MSLLCLPWGLGIMGYWSCFGQVGLLLEAGRGQFGGLLAEERVVDGMKN